MKMQENEQSGAVLTSNTSQTRSAHSVATLVEEIVPSNTILKTSKHLTRGERLHKNVQQYYKRQEELQSMLADGDEINKVNEPASKFATRAAKISLACNLLLLIGKTIACVLSGSLSIISSLVDSAIDLISGVLIWLTNRSIRMTNFYEYPVGKTRLEPLAITVLSVIMAIASLQIIIESVQSLVKNSSGPDMSLPTIIIICGTIGIKILLFLYCRRYNSPSTEILTHDHRNDVISNIVALTFGYIGDRWWKPGDAVGAILISTYIAYGWFSVGWQQVKSLSGFTATPELLTKLLQVCCNFDNRIQFIDTLRAYHFGNNLIVEVHIVLPPQITLQEAHDVGEPLQRKLEMFSFVERAFVHIDYECEHRPEDEHYIAENVMDLS
ncbi:metal tolerance protein 11-like [Dendronephthya gigantea]|uniref:metal tolerance protein 11-like n=1 Tax=Dendronephthya gigantea TaxID=151771 RepID=UPI00106A2377|nr:metal tolerance protein 11-like [Dendronephthya gigantea]